MKKCKLDLAKKLTGKQKRELKKQFPKTPEQKQKRENIITDIILVIGLAAIAGSIYLFYLCWTYQI